MAKHAAPSSGVSRLHLWRSRHLILAGLWATLAAPALIWWADSIVFVIMLSLYANFEASLSAHHALKSEHQATAED